MAFFKQDLFTRADAGTLGSDWSNDAGAFGISSNAAACSSLGGNGFAVSSLTGFTPPSANYIVSADVTSVSASTSTGIIGRFVDVDNWYIAYISAFDQTINLAKNVAGSFTSLGSFTGGYSTGNTYNIRLEMFGTSLEVFVDGVSRITATDSAFTSAGLAGIFADATSNTIDNFLATTVTPAVDTDFATSVTSMAVNLPSHIASGDLLIAVVEVRNAGTWTLPTDWVQIFSPVSAGGVGDLTAFYKIADGTEGATATWTASVATTGSWQARKITSWDGSTAPEATTANSGGVPSTNDPPSLSPSWGSADTLWIAVMGNTAQDVSITAAPTNYISFLENAVSSGGAAVNTGTAYYETTASSEDPGSFTTGSDRWWQAATIGIKPAGGAPSPLAVSVSDSITVSESINVKRFTPPKFYVTNASAGFTPTTIRGAWDNTTKSGSVFAARQAPQGAAATSAQAETSTTNLFDVLLGRWVSDPLATDIDFNTADTVNWILGVVESSTSANDFFHVHIFVTKGDSDTLRGTLLTDNIGATEWTATATGRGEGTKTLSAVSALAGDRIVFEVGYQAANTSATSFTGTMNYGNTGTTDLAQGNTTVTTRPGWFSFSKNVTTALSVSESESITVTDSPTMGPPTVPPRTISVSDSITVSESIGRTLVLNVNPVGATTTTSFINVESTVINSGTVNPDNGWADDSAYVTFDGLNDTVRYRNNNNFSIPTGAVIVGLQVKLNVKYTGAGINKDITARISANGGTTFSSLKSADVPDTTDSDVTLGSTSDVWGKAWTPANFNSNNNLHIEIGLASLSVTSVDLDAVSLAVSYAFAGEQITVSESVSAEVVAGGSAPDDLTISVSDSITVTDTPFVRFSATTLRDDFNDNSIDTTKWNAGGDTNIVETNGQMQISTTTTSAYHQLVSVDSLDITGGAVSAHLVDAGNQSLTSFEAIINIYEAGNADNKIYITVSNGNISLRQIVSGSNSLVGSSATYDSATMKYLRIREDSGTYYAEYALYPTGTWTEIAHVTSFFDANDIRTELQAGNWQAEASGSTAVWDDFNFNTLYISVSDSITVSETINAIETSFISVSDSVTVTEAVTPLLTSFVSVSDSVSVSESVSVAIVSGAPDLEVSVSESITVSESIGTTLISLLSVSDSVYVFEGANRVPTYSFEETAGDGTTPTGWSTYNTAGSQTYKGIANDFASDGSNSYKITGNGLTDTGIRVNVVVPNGSVIVLSAYMKTTSDVDNAGIILSTEQNGSGGAATTTNLQSGATDGRISASMTVDTALVEIFLGMGSFGAQSDGTVWFDDIKLHVYENVTLVNNVSVSDSVTVSESVSLLETSFVSVSDSITVTDTPSVLVTNPGDLNINVSDTITVTDTPVVRLLSFVNVSDSITVSESVTADVSDPQVTASDTITVSESITVDIPLTVSVSDTITVSEAINAVETSFIAVSDEITVSESVSVTAPLLVSVSDTITVSESVAARFADYNVIASETISVSESVNVTVSDPQISVSDTITVSENINPNLESHIAVSDDITVSESVNLALSDLQVYASDTITVSESVGMYETIDLAVSDTITVTDTPNALVSDPQISVSDSITVSESLKTELNSDIRVSDTITVSESVSVVLPDPLQINVSDTITVTDTPNINHVLFIRGVSDTVTVTDSVIIGEPHIPDYVFPKFIIVDGRVAMLIVKANIPQYMFVT